MCAPSPRPRIEDNFPVPAAAVGIVIGSGGATIKAIRERTQTRITGPVDNVFKIRGMTPEAVSAARDAINSLIAGAAARHDWVTLGVPVPSEAVGGVIGAKGATVKGIAARTRAIISGPNADGRMTVKGTPDAVEAARVEIEAVVARVCACPPSPSLRPRALPLPAHSCVRVCVCVVFAVAAPPRALPEWVEMEFRATGPEITKVAAAYEEIAAQSRCTITRRDRIFVIQGTRGDARAAEAALAKVAHRRADAK